MRRTEKQRSILIALVFIFLCAQAYSIVVKAHSWKSASEQARESYLSDGNDRPLSLPEYISDTHAGLSDDTSSTVFLSASVPHTLIRIPETYEKFFFDIPPEQTVITKYRRSVIAIQTVK